MANKLRGEMPLTLSGEEYTLRPTFSALADIEGAFGGIPKICDRFRNGEWMIKEVVGITQLLLVDADIKPQAIQSAVMETGPAVIASGLHLCLLSAFTGVTIEELTEHAEDDDAGNADAPTTTN